MQLGGRTGFMKDRQILVMLLFLPFAPKDVLIDIKKNSLSTAKVLLEEISYLSEEYRD